MSELTHAGPPRPSTPAAVLGVQGISTPRLLLIGALFGVSGASALVYQVAWQRILALHSGVGIYSVAVIVAAFLAGLGLGSYIGGLLSARTAARKALRVFALLELAIGVFAFVSCKLYYDLLYLRFPEVYASPWSAAILHFLTLMLPTALMGMSLPFLVRATVDDPRTASRTIGYVYGVNVLGAAIGALLAPWVLMRWLGVEGAVWVGGAGNVLAGVSAWLLSLHSGTRAEIGQPEVRAMHDATESPGGRPFALWVALYTVTGFCALSLEIVWFRFVDVAVKSTAFTFGTVLAVYLLGLGAGSLVGGPLALRLRRPLEAFLVSQCLLLAYSGAVVLVAVALPPDLPILDRLVGFWAQYDEFRFGEVWEWDKIFQLYLVLPLGLYGPPTFLMGVSFCILQRAVQNDPRTSGRKVGILQAANIVGNVAGSLITGLLLLSSIGTMGSLRLLLCVGVSFALLGIAFYGPRLRLVFFALLLFALFVLAPANDSLWLRLHGRFEGPALIGEDASGVVVIAPDESVGALRVSVNGKGHSWLPFGDIHSQLGVLPAVIHPAPKDVAIIGLGSGDTAWAASSRPETESVTVFELIASEERLLREASREVRLPGLARFLSDPRVRIVTADGRSALAREARTYDLIEADALRPRSAYSGNLYSVEFFELCARRLKPGGLMCTWAPTPRIYTTFCRAFPHVIELNGGNVLVGSNQPLAIDHAVWEARLGDQRLVAYLGSGILSRTAAVLASAQPAMPESYRAFRANRDLFPRDELLTPAGR